MIVPPFIKNDKDTYFNILYGDLSLLAKIYLETSSMISKILLASSWAVSSDIWSVE